MEGELIKIVKEAGNIIMKYYNTSIDIDLKEDHSPVTKADIEASEYLEIALKKMYPNHEIISEEKIDNNFDFTKNIWFIDPLDWTKFFIEKKWTFSILLSCLEEGKIKMGILYFPVKDKLIYAEEWKWCFEITSDGKKQILVDETNNDFILAYKNVGKTQDSINVYESINAIEKKEVRPTWFILDEFLQWNYSMMLLWYINKFEAWTVFILCKEAGYYIWDISWNWLDITKWDKKVMTPVIACKKNLKLSNF